MGPIPLYIGLPAQFISFLIQNPFFVVFLILFVIFRKKKNKLEIGSKKYKIILNKSRLFLGICIGFLVFAIFVSPFFTRIGHSNFQPIVITHNYYFSDSAITTRANSLKDKNGNSSLESKEIDRLTFVHIKRLYRHFYTSEISAVNKYAANNLVADLIEKHNGKILQRVEMTPWLDSFDFTIQSRNLQDLKNDLKKGFTVKVDRESLATRNNIEELPFPAFVDVETEWRENEIRAYISIRKTSRYKMIEKYIPFSLLKTLWVIAILIFTFILWKNKNILKNKKQN